MLGLLNTVLSRGGSLLTYVKDGLVMANRFLTPPKLSHPVQGSAEFNGTSDYIDVNKSINKTFGAITFWMYRDVVTNGSTTGIYPIDFKAGVGEFAVALGGWTGSLTNEVISLGAQTPSPWRIGWTTADTNAIPAGWNHVAITQTNAAYSIYLNGSSVPITNYSTPLEFDVEKVNIGARQDSSAFYGYYDGNLANVAIWNRALSSDEINSVMWKSYEGLTSKESTGLQAWYSLDDITSPAASLANMQQLATDKNATIENTAAITAAINSLS